MHHASLFVNLSLHLLLDMLLVAPELAATTVSLPRVLHVAAAATTRRVASCVGVLLILLAIASSSTLLASLLSLFVTLIDSALFPI